MNTGVIPVAMDGTFTFDRESLFIPIVGCVKKYGFLNSYPSATEVFLVRYYVLPFICAYPEQVLHCPNTEKLSG